MTVCPPPAQRWLACAGLVAATTGVCGAAPGWSAPATIDAPSAVRAMALQPSGLAPPSLPAAPPARSAQPEAAAATSPPDGQSSPPAGAVGRNPFRPLLSADGVPVGGGASAGSGAAFALQRVLGPGATGVDVRQVQSRLVGRGRELAVDGVYGPRTTASVRDFQRAEGLAVDGLVGPQTWNALRRGS